MRSIWRLQSFIWKKLVETNDIHLAIVDIMMPIMDGYEATIQIRKKDKKIPILAMSANAFVEDMLNSKIAGMNMHLAKPLDETKLINALKQCKKDERVN